MEFDTQSFGPRIAQLLEPLREAPLDAGTPNLDALEQLRSSQGDALFTPRAIREPDMVKACRAGLWLYHDFLDESHSLSQDIHNPSGSFWHGQMHRREGEFSNAKYWFRQTGEHPVFAPLAAESRDLAAVCGESQCRFLTSQSDWDPFKFVDLCEAALAGNQELDALCRRIQTCEWRLLFQHCFQHAVR